MRIRRHQPHHRSRNDLTHQSEAKALDAFLEDLHQQARAAGITGRATPEEQASYDALLVQISGHPEGHFGFHDLAPGSLSVELLLRHTPLWVVYRTLVSSQKGFTPQQRADLIDMVGELPPKNAGARMTADYAKNVQDLLRLTEGWDQSARRSATLAQVGLDPPEPPPEHQRPRGTA